MIDLKLLKNNLKDIEEKINKISKVDLIKLDKEIKILE